MCEGICIIKIGSQETQILDFLTRVKGIIPLWCAEAKSLRKKPPTKANDSLRLIYAERH